MAETEKHIVLVLGAGASKPYGFPLGKELIEEICAGFAAAVSQRKRSEYKSGLLTFSDEIQFEAHKAEFVNKAVEFSRALRESATLSIDDFLESRGDLETDGKIAIASVLLEHERKSVLYGLQIEDDWYRMFSNWLLPQKKEGLGGSNTLSKVFVITFNYDRSLEEYVFSAVRNRYKLDERDAAEVLDRIPIVHVYGSLGRLPWQRTMQGGSDTPVAFGADPATSEDDVLTIAAKSIRVMHEGEPGESERDSYFAKARDGLTRASAILFLGFGYHEANIRRLNPIKYVPEKGRGHVTVAGTVEGLGKGEIAKVRRLLRRYAVSITDRPDLLPYKTLKFLNETNYL